MTDRETFLATVLDNPSDDTVRLVLADLLRESDDVGEQARGRFLWAGVTAAGFKADDLIEDHLYYTAQAELAAVTIAGHPARWLGLLGFGPSPLVSGAWAWDSTHDRVTIRIGDVVGIFTRGMLSELSITLGEWYPVASAVLTSWPLGRVSIVDVPGLTFGISKSAASWDLSARLQLPGRRVPLTGMVSLTTLVPASGSDSPVLTEGAGDWRVEEPFADRSALVAGVASMSGELVATLREVAGDRWPPPPRKRR